MTMTTAAGAARFNATRLVSPGAPDGEGSADKDGLPNTVKAEGY